MSVDRSRFIPASSEAADEAISGWLGGPETVKKGDKKFFFFMPAYTTRDGRGVWFSVANRHYGVPLTKGQGEDRQLWTFDCPQSVGSRCIVCENKKLFQQLGVWGDNNRQGCKPSRRIRFNVINVQYPDRGVLVFEDGTTTLKMLRTILQESPNIMDPFDGTVLVVKNLGEDPWRYIAVAEGGKMSLDEIHPDALSWALPENLPNLDESWNFPSYEEQVAKFTGINPNERTLPISGEQAQLTAGDDGSQHDDGVIDVTPEPEPEQEPERRPWESDDENKPKPTGSTSGSSLLEMFQAEIDGEGGDN